MAKTLTLRRIAARANDFRSGSAGTLDDVVRRLGILALVALALTGCGGSSDSTTSTTAQPPPATTTTGTSANGTALRAFFYRGGGLVPVSVVVPDTQAVARASLEQLLAGPPATGYETAVPSGVELKGVEIQDGVATASFSTGLGQPTRSAQGQIVSTLTQFPTVRAVTIEVDGKPLPLQDGAGEDLTRPATAADYADLTPGALIFVRTPSRDSTVTSPVELAGTASVFEATINMQIWSGGKLLGTKLITASAGAPEQGTWSTKVALPKGDVRLLLYEPSAKDGSHLHETEVRLHVQ